MVEGQGMADSRGSGNGWWLRVREWLMVEGQGMAGG